MWVAVGRVTNKVYAEGKYKIDVLRTLQKEYPYVFSEHGNYRQTSKPVYPESLRLVKKKYLR